MKKHLEKTWEVKLVPHDLSWGGLFELEKREIQAILEGRLCEVVHIGSTAIKGIYAKPVIDVLVVVDSLAEIESFNLQFERLGYTCMGEFGIAGRRFYWKSPNERTHHIHLFQKGNAEIARHIAFRDYLLNHADVAQAYSWVKRYLAEQFSDDRENYVNGKESFIRMVDYQTGNAKQDQLHAKDEIILEPYNPAWKKLAAAEISAIKQFVKLPYIAIEHLGSTSVEGLSAKPIIDIFIALSSMDEASDWIKPLKALGYIDWPENPDKTHSRFFKGMPPYGTSRTHHLHIIEIDKFKKRFAFRDALISNTELRQRYENLKQTLAKTCGHDRELYTERKAAFFDVNNR